MSPDERLELARQTALEKRNALAASGAAPCATCIYRKDMPSNPGKTAFDIHCVNPAVANTKYDNIAGRVTVTSYPATRARLPAGICGPEGALHETRRMTFGNKVALVYMSLLGAGAAGLAINYLAGQ